MGEPKEFEAKTVEEAIEMACKEFAVNRDKLQIDILSNGSSGIFGLVGAKKAKIRVTFEDMDPQKELNQAKYILEKILTPFDLPVVVEGAVQDDHIALNIVSNGSGLLIGKRGQTLDALQYIVNKIIKKQFPKNLPVIVDTENYRERRKQTLVDLAKQLGKKARKTSKPVASNAMSAHDRRIIHITLKKEKGVKTRSKGNGAFRKVVVFPTRKNNASSEEVSGDSKTGNK